VRTLWFSLCCLAIFGILALLIYQPLWLTAQPTASPSVVTTPPETQKSSLRPLKICSDLWMPYTGEAGTAREGYLIDIMRQVYEPLGYQVEYSTLPWTRCVQEVREGRYDGLVGTVFSQTPDMVFPESSLGIDQAVFYTLPGSRWSYTGLQDLQRVRLGVAQDYDYTELLDLYLRRNAKTGKVWFARGEYPLDRMVAALQDGDIDVFVEGQEVVSYYMKQHRGRVRIRTAGPIGPAVRIYAAFSPRLEDAEAFAQMLDRKIDDLRVTGQLQAILDRYGMTDWRHKQPAADRAGVGR